jgi:hypothetical protein
VGQLGSVRGGPSWPGHVSSRLDGGAARQQRAPATVGAGEYAPEVKERATEVVVHAAELGEGRSGATMELGGDIHGGLALARAFASSRRGEEQARVREEWRASKHRRGFRRGALDAWRGGRRAALCMVAMRQIVEHVVGAEWSKVGSDLG